MFASSGGAVYMFESKNGGPFVQTQLLRVNSSAADTFGREMAFSPDGMQLMVTADGVDAMQGSTILYSVGAAYFFAYGPDGWQLVRRSLAPDVAQYQYYGRGVAW
jgi:hypothetical protein